jgi:hypothetical protein
MGASIIVDVDSIVVRFCGKVVWMLFEAVMYVENTMFR